jgi:hypothetical protein
MTQLFADPIARVVFGDLRSPALVAVEDAFVQRFTLWIGGATLPELRQYAQVIDQMAGSLSGVALLDMARLIEARCPDLLITLPNLAVQLHHLDKVQVISRAFMPHNLEALANALAFEVGA